MKNFFVFVKETATLTQIPQTAYGKKLVCETWQTPTILFAVCHFFIISPLFHRSSQIVYSGLKNFLWSDRYFGHDRRPLNEQNPYFFNFFQQGVQICTDFSLSVRIFSLINIKPIFSALAAKSTDCIDKCFKQKLYKIKFPKKKVSGRMSLSTPEVEQGGTKDLSVLR